MRYLGTLTPEEVEALGVPRSELVITPVSSIKSRESQASKNPPSSSGRVAPENSEASGASSSAEKTATHDMSDLKTAMSIQDKVDQSIDEMNRRDGLI